jgi:hypothetical protein
MKEEGAVVNRRTAHPQRYGPDPFARPGIIQFGIVCCALTMVIVLAVAIAAR